jgi:hypothetical protein
VPFTMTLPIETVDPSTTLSAARIAFYSDAKTGVYSPTSSITSAASLSLTNALTSTTLGAAAFTSRFALPTTLKTIPLLSVQVNSASELY